MGNSNSSIFAMLFESLSTSLIGNPLFRLYEAVASNLI
jgi:hypothetical protein